MKEIKVVLGLIAESVSFAIASLKSEKLRTFLSLFGVTIGIFSIVTVLCAVDSMKKNIMDGIKSFGSDAMFIDTYPFMGNGEETDEDGNVLHWWDYMQRKPITEEQVGFVSEHLTIPGNIVWSKMIYTTVSFGRNKASNAEVMMTTAGIERVMTVDLADGRGFSELEFRSGANVALIGDGVAEALFTGVNPIGQRIKVFGANTIVVGVLNKAGESMASIIETDNTVIIPWQYGKRISKGSAGWKNIMAAPGEGADKQEFKDELRRLLRSCRGVPPSKKDDFSINEMTFLLDAMDDIFSQVSLAGWIIGAFSLLIGGFGIANIMFVSVKERMNQIGIQKALGAKKYVILTQYLVEASVLSVSGGAFGLLIVWLFFKLASTLIGFPLEVSMLNTVNGIGISMVIGILAGIIPAYQAASTDPVKAINLS